jgi:nucleotide-binding universal stress UspA family protein
MLEGIAMIKDIVVNLSVAPNRDVAGDYAVSLASAFEAHVAGIAFVYDPVPPVITMGGIPAEVLESLRRENEEAAAAVLAKFDRLTDRMRLSTESRIVPATFVGASDAFAQAARRFDVSVVGQPEPNRLAPEELIIEGALFASGRPVVVVPYIQKSGLTLGRVLVCWDGSRNAARAIADAMPFLVKAKTVEVVIVANEVGKSDELSGADIGRHLARHGLRVEVQRIFSRDMDVANTILSHATDMSADFIIMGGYGHSRVREFILGGATRGILTAMTVPTLMSH